MKHRNGQQAPPTGSPQAVEAEQALLDYARLVSDLLHEFRTPLSSIVGAASVLHDYGGTIDEAVRSRLCTGIIGQAQRLDGLLAALAAIARVRSGKLVNEERPLELNELLHGLATKLRGHPERPVHISVHQHEIFIKADPVIVQAVLVSMLDLTFIYAADGRSAELSLSNDAQRTALRVESSVRDEERARLKNLIGKQTSQTATEAPAPSRPAADAVFLAAIQEFVHILGGKFTILYDDAAARLRQTVTLST